MSRKTKAQLLEELAELESDLTDEQSKVQRLENELRTANRKREDADAVAKNLRPIIQESKQAIEQHLVVDLESRVYPETTWLGGETITKEQPTTEIRFLRFLYEILSRDKS